MRTDLRWDDDDPVAQLLSTIPQRQRAKLIRAIVEAALLPGGWAKLAQGQLRLRNHDDVEGPSVAPDPPAEDRSPAIADMNAAGTQGFLAGLRQFGALDDD